MNIRLTSAEKDMLIEVKDRFKSEKKLEFEMKSTCVVLKELTEDDAVDVRELCSDYLTEVGFDADYGTNEKGKILEELVDKLYVE